MFDMLVPPLCFLLAIAMLVSAFGLYAVGTPEIPYELHQARISGNEAAEEVLEKRWRFQQRRHRLMVFGLFGGSIAFFVTAFLSMRPAERR